jgi:hypothetical protein
VAVTSLPVICWSMDIQWTRMAGQWPAEASGLVGNFTGTNKEEILVLNRGGQLLLWRGDGAAIGSGQDGAVAQLPAGRWTTSFNCFGGIASLAKPFGVRPRLRSCERRLALSWSSTTVREPPRV